VAANDGGSGDYGWETELVSTSIQGLVLVLSVSIVVTSFSAFRSRAQDRLIFNPN